MRAGWGVRWVGGGGAQKTHNSESAAVKITNKITHMACRSYPKEPPHAPDQTPGSHTELTMRSKLTKPAKKQLALEARILGEIKCYNSIVSLLKMPLPTHPLQLTRNSYKCSGAHDEVQEKPKYNIQNISSSN